jgi:hypothetical protein
MPAGFGAESQFRLEAGDYLCQVVDVTTMEFDSRKQPGKKDRKWKWIIDAQPRGSQEWQRSDILTGQRFLPKEQIKGPQFVPTLHYFHSAINPGVPIPRTAEEAMAWDENAQIGKRFLMRIRLDEHSQELVTTFMPVRQGAQAPASAPVPPPVPAPPATAPAPPATDPFAPEQGESTVAGDEDPWDE